MPAEVRAGVTPKVKADKPRGEWNTFEITVKGDRLWVKLNGTEVIQNAQLPGIPEEGPLALQHHGSYDAATGQSTATDGHRIVSSKPGEVTVESTRYPYCFERGNNHPFGPTASILPYLPFNQDLNRYLLVVKNLKSPKAR